MLRTTIHQPAASHHALLKCRTSAVSFSTRLVVASGSGDGPQSELNLHIAGMTCGGCSSSVEDAALKAGAKRVSVDLVTGVVRLTVTAGTESLVMDALKAAGWPATVHVS